MKKIFLIAVAATISLGACNSDSKKADSKKAAPKTEVSKAKKYKLSAFTPSQQYADAEILGMDYSAGKFDFDIADGTYELGQQTPDAPQKMCANSAKGQHIHLIIDNKPYAAKYTSEFDYDVDDGKHFLLAFLSRSYHESIKTDKAHVVQQIEVKNKKITAAKPVSQSMLFYSRPKGTYVGKKDTEKVMLDFYAVNANIGITQKVIAKINGEEHEINKWQPYYIEGLPMGENTVELTLVNKDGSKVNVPLNPVTRTFTLKADPAE